MECLNDTKNDYQEKYEKLLIKYKTKKKEYNELKTENAQVQNMNNAITRNFKNFICNLDFIFIY